jgi:hypothetical protein
MLKLTSNILEEIKNGQKKYLELVDRVVLVNQGNGGDFRLSENSVLMFRDRVCVPDVLELKRRILEKGHRSSLSIHPGATKMYQDLKRLCLVAWNEEGDYGVCVCLFGLSEV